MINNISVLIVDDEVDIRELLGEEVASLGVRVLLAKSGNEAFKVLQQEDIAIVFTDLNMADGTGEELLQKIKNDPKINPVCFVTGGLVDYPKERLQQLNVTGFFDKPFDYDNICNQIKALLLKAS